MKSKLKEGWIPKFQTNWNKYRRDSRGRIIQRPQPKYPPNQSNHDRMQLRALARQKKREAREVA